MREVPLRLNDHLPNEVTRALRALDKFYVLNRWQVKTFKHSVTGQWFCPCALGRIQDPAIMNRKKKIIM